MQVGALVCVMLVIWQDICNITDLKVLKPLHTSRVGSTHDDVIDFLVCFIIILKSLSIQVELVAHMTIVIDFLVCFYYNSSMFILQL